MKKILAIDDQQDNLTTIKAVLKNNILDCLVLTATSGSDGIEIALLEKPDAILLDIIMPKMDGYETCKKLKENELTKHIPVIMITAIKTDIQSRVKALDLGADAFLSKPIDAVELTAQVNVMLRIKEAEDKLREEKDILEDLVFERTKDLQQSEENYQSIFDGAKDGIIYTSKGLNVLAVNNAFTEITGIAKETVIGKTAVSLAKKFINIKWLPQVLSILKEMLLGSPISDFVLNFQDKIFEISSQKLKNGRSVNIIRDITNRKKVEEEIIKLSKAVEQSPVSILITDTDGEIEYGNPKVTEITGYNLKELIGRNPKMFKSGEKQKSDYENLWSTISSGKEWIGEFHNKKKNGDLYWEHASISPILNEEGEITHYIAVKEDITERKRSEQIKNILLKISNAVNTTNNLEQLIGTIRKELGKIIDTTNFYLALYNDKTDTLSLPFFSDKYDSFTSLPAEKTITSYVIRTNESLLANLDALKELENAGEIKRYGADSLIWLGAPLKIDGEVIGALVVQSYTDENAYDESDKKMLEFISSQISISIHRKNTNDLLRKSEERYRSLVVNLPIGIFQSTFEGKILSANPAMAEMYGYDSVDELIKVPADKYYSKNNPREEMLIALKKKGYLLEYETIENKKDGSSIWVSANYRASFNANGNINSIEGTIIDITKRKNASQLLIKSEERFDLAMKASNDGLYDWNLLNDEVYYSSRWKSILGYSDEELPNKLSVWEDLSHPEERDASLLKLQNAVKQKIEHYNVEFRMKHKLGHWVNILSRAELIYDENGKAVRVVGTHSDLTKEKKAEQNLKTALLKAEESDRLKSAFLANMSHEIRTPMNGILGFSELLKEPGIEGDEQLKYIKIIETSGNRMLNIINDLIDISKIEAGQAEVLISEVNVNEQIEYLHTFFRPEAEKAGLQLSFNNTLPKHQAIIESDREKIYAILTNLIKNAIKYTKQGSIEFGYELKEGIELEGNIQKQDQFEFYVKDTGIGIAKDKQEAIFDRFVQADLSLASEYEGAGLGLAITKGYIEILGGEIWVESKEDQGSQFYFTLPYTIQSDQTSSEKTDIKSPKETNQKKLNILIAEDDETSMIFLTELTKNICKEVTYAETGVEAIAICKKKQNIDLIFMDIKMPEMDGYEASRKIREFNKDVVIIAQTAYALEGDREKAIEAGCNDYVSKPIPKEKLLETVWKNMRKN